MEHHRTKLIHSFLLHLLLKADFSFIFYLTLIHSGEFYWELFVKNVLITFTQLHSFTLGSSNWSPAQRHLSDINEGAASAAILLCTPLQIKCYQTYKLIHSYLKCVQKKKSTFIVSSAVETEKSVTQLISIPKISGIKCSVNTDRTFTNTSTVCIR